MILVSQVMKSLEDSIHKSNKSPAVCLRENGFFLNSIQVSKEMKEGKMNQKHERHTIRLDRFDLHESGGKFYYSTEFHCLRFTLCGGIGICAISPPSAPKIRKYFPHN